MPTRHAIVIAVDGLRASALGAYGNAWHQTPAIDRLASESLLYDWLIVDSPELAGYYRAAWCGLPCPADGVEREPSAAEIAASLPHQLAAAGVAAAVTTDDPLVAAQADRLGFPEVRSVEFPAPTLSAENAADTELAQLFAVAAEQIEAWADDATQDDQNSAAGRLLWLHARGYRGAWDAPLELRQSLLDEDDPEASDAIAPPSRVTTEDADELLLHRAAYAAQTMVLDECIAALLASLEAAGLADSTLLVLTGCRGFALGEHVAVGAEVLDLYGELLHVPLVMRLAASAVAPPRAAAIVQPADLPAALLDWFNVNRAEADGPTLLNPIAASIDASSSRALATDAEGTIAIRTASWFFKATAQTSEAGQTAPARVELYSKPDDRWEANEIAVLCEDDAQTLLAEATAYQAGETLASAE